MSTDRRVTTNLIETLEDGRDGFASAADKLADSNRPDLSATMRTYSQQRAEFATELELMAANYGDDIDEDGSVAAAVHRGWMAVKDAIAGSDPDGVLDAAEQGEDHALAAYDEALEAEISTDLRTTVQRQYGQVKQAHDAIKALRDAQS